MEARKGLDIMYTRKLTSDLSKETILNYLVREAEYRKQVLDEENAELERIDPDIDMFSFKAHLRWRDYALARYQEVQYMVRTLKIADAE